MEEFRKIDGFENYEISNFGNVRNVKTGNIIKSSNNRGYRILNLKKGDKLLTVQIHRLIAKTFIPNPNNKPFIDHIDNNRSNNSIDNLRWCSNQENQFNKRTQKNNLLGFKGISYHKRDKLYTARFKYNKILFHIGCYKNVDDAIIARYNKALEIHKEFIHQEEIKQYNEAVKRKQEKEEQKELDDLEAEWVNIIDKCKNIVNYFK